MEGLHVRVPPARDNENEPKDTYHTTYMIHFLLGAGYLIPWNSFITAVDYFDSLYPSKHVSKVFSVAYMAAALSVLSVLTCWSSSGKMRLPGFRVRMNLGLGLFVLALMVAPVTDWIDRRNEVRRGSDVAFVVVVLMVAVTGFAEGLTSGSLIGATGKLPRRYMQAVVAGNASAVSVVRIITRASLPNSMKGLQTSTHIYFITSTFVELLCILFCNLLRKLPIIQYHTQNHNTTAHITNFDNPPKNDPEPPNFLQVLKKIRWLALSMATIYIVTLSIFPGYLSENVTSTHFGTWYPVFLITTFNVGDFLGKCLTAFYVVKWRRVAIWGCFLRVLLYPLFRGCVEGPKWLRSEGPVVVLRLLLGVSNGYLTSALMIIAPKSVAIEESEIVGIVMTLFLAIGLVIGSGLGWLWNIK